MSGLVLSLFPGIGMLDIAFEEAGFAVVRGPDLLWGGDVRKFHVPAGRFDGVIAGPPCQFASALSRLNAARGLPLALNLIGEFERIVAEASPDWFAMENVVEANLPVVASYTVTSSILRDVWCGGETLRKRRFSLGSARGVKIHVPCSALHADRAEVAITSCARDGGGRKVVSGKERHCSTIGPRLPIEEMARRQGLPPHFFGDASPFTAEAKRKMLGNGVPLAMGRAVAAAITRYVLLKVAA